MDPTISIIVPVFNDPQGIRTTLYSLLNLTQLELLDEIVVVDNASTDRTPDVVQSMTSRSDLISLHYETEIQSSYAARNTGISNTQSDFLAFIDADMSVSEEWLGHVKHELGSTDAEYIGCRVELKPPTIPSVASRYDYHTGFPVERYLTNHHFAPTCCLFVLREVFEDVGLFDPRLTSGGDKEFGNRVHEAGYDMHFAKDVTVYHPTRNTIREHASKDLRVGRGLCQLQRYHPVRYGRPGIPPRPSGAKYPNPAVSRQDRLTFSALGTFLTGMRGIGYYRELIAPSPAPDIDDIPTLD